MLNPIQALKDFIRQPSVSADSQYAAGMKGAREYVSNLLSLHGFTVEAVATPLHPIIVAKRKGEPSWPHVLIYGHYDVQPPDPLDLWTTPPFDPEEREGRLYGRGAADNKGPLIVHMAALLKLLEEQPGLPLRVTFVIEGEEEIGSPSFIPFLEKYKKQLDDADFVLLSDTGSPSSGQIVITTGLRGITCLEVEVTGPRSDLHSGVHGGAVLNPIQALAELCSSLHTTDGRVNVPGFYDDVLDVEDWEKEELKKLGTLAEEYARFLGVRKLYTVEGFTPFECVRFLPTLEFNGITGGYQGMGSKTIIPSKASVKISCRLVANQNSRKIQKQVIATLEERCPEQININISASHSGEPYLVVPPGRPNTPTAQPPALARAFQAADEAIAHTFGKKPLYLREGGSIPIIGDIKRIVGIDSLMIGLFLPEDNLHAPDESFHLGVMKKGVEVSREVLLSVAERR
ncbi:MAG: M20/M25/M40 family metallo-hydrolase [Opitutales bacterium]